MQERNKKYKNKLLEAAHEMAQGLCGAHVINAATMREFDALCMPPVKKLSPRKN